jgi:hypothetical protein
VLTVAEFRELVRGEFGPRLERATPASVREFLDGLQVRLHKESGEGPPYVLDQEDTAGSYEEIVAEFFSRILDYDSPEQAFILLWLLAFEQHFSMLEEDYSQRYLTLFGEGEGE